MSDENPMVWSDVRIEMMSEAIVLLAEALRLVVYPQPRLREIVEALKKFNETDPTRELR